MMGITTLKSKIRDFQQLKETRGREEDAEALTTNYMAGIKFQPYSTGRIFSTDTARSNRKTFVNGPLYKEASDDEKGPKLHHAIRNHNAEGIDLDPISKPFS